jgi:hypothetical protein
MADETLVQSSDYANLTEAEQLAAYARVAATYDTILNDVAAVLHAINAGDLFSHLPADEAYRSDHTAGSFLLSGLSDRVQKAQEEIDAAPGTDLFIYLECRADDSKRADG